MPLSVTLATAICEDDYVSFTRVRTPTYARKAAAPQAAGSGRGGVAR